MTYEELFYALNDAVGDRHSVCMEVETWRRPGSRMPVTTWKVYIRRDGFGGERETYEGPTAQDVWNAFEAVHCTETLTETSASVGHALGSNDK